MKRLRLFVLCLVWAPSLAWAQVARPPENVTVSGMRHIPDAVITQFVESVTSPSRAGKIARWNKGVCPKTTGLAPKFAAYITWRVRDIAAQIGAPVDSEPSCKTNIRILFIDQPQAFLDGLRKKSPAYLGYYDNEAQADALAKVTRPVQSWYVTQTEDVHGALHFDSHASGGMVEVPVPCIIPPCTDSDRIRIPDAQVYATTGTRLGDGLSSVLYHVLIVADPAKLKENEVGALADYIAMLSLAQIVKPDVCASLSSILNMLVPDCPQKPAAMTVSDAAFLRGIYKMTRDTTLGGQRAEVSYQIRRSLAAGGEKAGQPKAPN